MLKWLASAARFWWRASAGHRMRPWRSAYLRWRVETYTGKPADSLRLRDFLGLAFSERRQVGRFFRWMGEMEGLVGERRS